MGDIEELCERVVIINQGQKVYDGALDQLKAKYAPEKVVEIYLDNLEDKKKFAHLETSRKKLEGGKGVIRVRKDQLGAVVKEIYNVFEAEKISIHDPEMEEIDRKIFRR